MRPRLFRLVARLGAGPAVLRILETGRRGVGALRAVRLRWCLRREGAEQVAVVSDGAAVYAARPLADGPPSWASVATQLADALQRSAMSGWRWERHEPDRFPVLVVERPVWRRLVSHLTSSSDAHLYVEGTTPRAAGGPVPCAPRRLRRLGGNTGAVELRVFSPFGGVHGQPVGRGAGVRLRVVDRLAATADTAHHDDRDDPPFPIDVVYAWVDGSDERWSERRRLASTSDGIATDGASHERFVSRDELRASLRSVHDHAPWVRHIYVVTDAQTPDWLDLTSDSVSVVDHRDLIGEEWLPTFNSHVIEANLHRIDGLSEHYIYFNDDVFLGRDVGWRTFFDAAGRSRYFPSPARVPIGGTSQLSIDAATVNGAELLARRFGVRVTQKMRHTPHPQRRSVHRWMESEFAGELERTHRSRFRSSTDQSFASFLHHHVGDQLGTAVASSIWYDYIGLAEPNLDLRLRGVLRRTDPFDCFCLNDASIAADDLAEVERIVQAFLWNAYPYSAPWEL